MTLTRSDGPLAPDAPSTTNYTVQGPKHKILFGDFPRRIRAVLRGTVVLDTTRGRLLHESNLLPVLYVPADDIDQSLLTPTDHTTHCPFKGDAAYWSVTVEGHVAENAVWGYPEPMEPMAFLADHQAVYFDAMDTWFDEDESIEGHVRDPYHRVDARRSSRHVVVRVGEQVVGETDRAMVVSETGMPNRFYIPSTDVRTDLLAHSTTRTHCPYKGWASYWSMRDGSADDVAFAYPDPFDDVARAKDLMAFWGDAVTITVDGARVPA